MALTLVNTDNITDDATFELDGAIAITAITLGGQTYVAVAGSDDDGVSTFQVSGAGVLTNNDNVDDTSGTDFELLGASAVATIAVGGQPFLFGAGFDDDGFSSFAALQNGSLLNADNITDGGSFELAGANGLATAVVGGKSFVFVAGGIDDGVSSFEIADDGLLTNRDDITDAGGLEIEGARGLATATVGGTTFLFVGGFVDNGISTFSVDANGGLTNADNVDDTDDAALELEGVSALATALVGNKTFLFAAGDTDDGVSVFEVAADGTLTNVDNVADDATLKLADARGIHAANIAGITYVFVASRAEDGVSVFAVAADGSLINVANIVDAGALELNGAAALTTATIAGDTFLFVASQIDDGVSTFRIDVTGVTINGTGGNDIINAVSSAPGELLPSELGDTINGLNGNDTINALGGADKIIGGRGRDILTGGADRDLFDFNSIKESIKGANRDRITDLKRGTDDIDLRTIDAKTGVGGNQKFKFIGRDDFSGEKGELRFKDLGAKVIVQGDVNGDGKADFEIFVAAGSLAKGDFLL